MKRARILVWKCALKRIVEMGRRGCVGNAVAMVGLGLADTDGIMELIDSFALVDISVALNE